MPPFHVCTVAIIDFLEDRGDWAARALPYVEPAAEAEPPRLRQAQTSGCTAVMKAGIAHVQGSAREAAQARAELESYLTRRPFGAKRLRLVANFLAAAIHERSGDDAAALRAFQRMEDGDSPDLLARTLREQGRILEKLGRGEEAAAAYRHYLALRANPAPHIAPIDDAIRGRAAELARRD